MKQTSLSEAGFEHKATRTGKREFPGAKTLVVSGVNLFDLIAPSKHQPIIQDGSPQSGVQTMLRSHFFQQWFNLSDTIKEKTLYDTTRLGKLVGLDMGGDLPPDKSFILHSRHRLL